MNSSHCLASFSRSVSWGAAPKNGERKKERGLVCSFFCSPFSRAASLVCCQVCHREPRLLELWSLKQQLQFEEITTKKLIQYQAISELPLTSFLKRVLVPILSYENDISFICNLNSFSNERFYTRPRFDREA